MTPIIWAAPRAWATIRAHSVVDADCRSWDIPNLWVCDGSVFPTVGGVNPSLTIQAIAIRTADRIDKLARPANFEATADWQALWRSDGPDGVISV